jgi:hypothetical protein
MHIVEFQSDESTIYCRPGDMIRVSGHYDSGARPLDHAFLEVDRGHAPLRTGVTAIEELDVEGGIYEVRPCDNPKSDNYSFDWVATTPGSHSIRVGYVFDNGGKKYTDRDTVVVLDSEPLVFNPTAFSSAVDLPVTVNVPQDSPFLPTKMEVFLDDKSIGTFSGGPFQFTLPLGSAKLGKHSIKIEAYNAGNSRYEYLGRDMAEVPTKMTLDVPSTASLDKSGTVTVNPKIDASYKPTKIDYYLKTPDGDNIAFTATATPFTGNVDMSKLLSGSYVIHAVATAADGPFTTDNYPIAITNAAADANAVAQAKANAEKKAQDADNAAEAAAAAALKEHPKLTWAQLHAKVSNYVAAYLVDHPVAGSTSSSLQAVERIDQPDPTKNVYTAAVVVGTGAGSPQHVSYTVDTDSGTVSPCSASSTAQNVPK